MCIWIPLCVMDKLVWILVFVSSGDAAQIELYQPYLFIFNTWKLHRDGKLYLLLFNGVLLRNLKHVVVDSWIWIWRLPFMFWCLSVFKHFWFGFFLILWSRRIKYFYPWLCFCIFLLYKFRLFLYYLLFIQCIIKFYIISKGRLDILLNKWELFSYAHSKLFSKFDKVLFFKLDCVIRIWNWIAPARRFYAVWMKNVIISVHRQSRTILLIFFTSKFAMINVKVRA